MGTSELDGCLGIDNTSLAVYKNKKSRCNEADAVTSWVAIHLVM